MHSFISKKPPTDHLANGSVPLRNGRNGRKRFSEKTWMTIHATHHPMAKWRYHFQGSNEKNEQEGWYCVLLALCGSWVECWTPFSSQLPSSLSVNLGNVRKKGLRKPFSKCWRTAVSWDPSWILLKLRVLIFCDSFSRKWSLSVSGVMTFFSKVAVRSSRVQKNQKEK